MRWIVKQFRKKSWSPYIAGVFFGVLNVLALVTINKPLGVSTAFDKLAGIALACTIPAAVDNVYYRFIMKPGINFTIFIFFGIIIGGFISSRISGDFRIRSVTDHQWIETFGAAPWKKWVVMFFSGVIMEWSAGLAGGCTSGLAIAGTMQLAPSGFLFIAGLFASGIPTSYLIYRKRY